MAYILNVSIGPVQGYIAAARRSRDLAYGSWLLSELACTAAQFISKNQGNLIFPSEASLNTPGQGIANKIVAEFADDPTNVARQLEDKLRERLAALWQATKIKLMNTEAAAQAAAQIDSLPEVVWVAVPITSDYASARRRADRLLAAAKATRSFGSSAAWASSAAKSSLTGQYESVIPPNGDETQRFENYGAGRNEQLSAIDLLKRRGERGTGESSSFASTSHMAALPLMRRFAGQETGELRTLWHSYTQALPPTIKEFTPGAAHPLFGNDDGALLFAGRLEAAFEERSKSAPHLERLTSFFQAAHTALKVGRPQPYYAILHADGDGMGKLISDKTSAADHRELSKQLGDFASNAATLIQQHGGAPIYTGGDDVLALVPLDTALACARLLAESFAHAIPKASLPKASLSVGLAVTHHLTPLYQALELARRAEKHAKNDAGRNALCVLLSKRSGGETAVYGHWKSFDTRLHTMVALHRTPGALPDGFAYELRELQRRLGETQVEAGRAEAKRLLKRKQASAKAQEQLLGWLDGTTPRELSQQLIVARVFADAEDQANSPLFEAETPV